MADTIYDCNSFITRLGSVIVILFSDAGGSDAAHHGILARTGLALSGLGLLRCFSLHFFHPLTNRDMHW